MKGLKKLFFLILFFSQNIFSSDVDCPASFHIEYGDSLLVSAQQFALDMSVNLTEMPPHLFQSVMLVHCQSLHFQAIEAYHRAEQQLDCDVTDDVAMLIDVYQKLSEIHSRVNQVEESIAYARKIPKGSKHYRWATQYLTDYTGDSGSSKVDTQIPQHTTHARLQEEIKKRAKAAITSPVIPKAPELENRLAEADRHMAELLEMERLKEDVSSKENPSKSQKKKARQRAAKKLREKEHIEKWMLSLVNQELDKIIEDVLVVNEALDKAKKDSIDQTVEQIIEQHISDTCVRQEKLEKRSMDLVGEAFDSCRRHKEDVFKKVEAKYCFLLDALRVELESKELLFVIVGGYAVQLITKSYQTIDVDITVYPKSISPQLSVLAIRSAVMQSLLNLKARYSMFQDCFVVSSTKKGTDFDSPTTPIKVIENRHSILDITFCLDSISPESVLSCGVGVSHLHSFPVLDPAALADRLLEQTTAEYVEKVRQTADTVDHKLASWKAQIDALSNWF